MAAGTNELHQVRKKKPAAGKGQKQSAYLRRIITADRDYFDYNLLAVVILLTCFGLIMLYSTSAYESMLESKNNSTMAYFGKQAVISAGALILALLGSQVDYHFLARFAFPLYGVSMALLVLTKIIGREVNGAKRWIYIGPISFQPAELAKVAVILFLPVLIVKIGKNIRSLKSVAIVLGCGALTAVFTYYFTENLSTALIILGISAGLVFIAHPKTAPFLGLLAAGIVFAVIFVLIVVNMPDGGGGFRFGRIRVWLDPEGNASDGGYQVMQGLYAVGSGGFFGKGLGNSTQKLGAVPEAQNDMIFAIICEELGVFGAAIVMLLFIFMLYRLFVIAQNAPDLLGSLIVTGIFVHIALQVVLNIAVVINLIPTTGITLPFVSYGGTSILFLMSEMALALGVSRQIRFQ